MGARALTLEEQLKKEQTEIEKYLLKAFDLMTRFFLKHRILRKSEIAVLSITQRLEAYILYKKQLNKCDSSSLDKGQN